MSSFQISFLWNVTVAPKNSGRYCNMCTVSGVAWYQHSFKSIVTTLCQDLFVVAYDYYTFSNDHFRYEQHQCSSGRRQGNQVPVCPLCSKPVPVKKGEIPDIRVGQHIDADCPSDTAISKRKVFANRCSAKGCKKSEMMRVECTDCRKTFCLAHRFPDDHSCQGVSVSESGGVSRSG